MDSMRFEAGNCRRSSRFSGRKRRNRCSRGNHLPVQLRADMIEPELVVDIKRISKRRTVTEEDGGYRIGAAVAGAELKEHPSFSNLAGRDLAV